MGNEYVHMRRLADLVTGQWEEEINTTPQGAFIDRTYTYTIPEHYRNIPANLGNMESVVFMTETTQEIISGNGTFPSLLGLEYDNDLSLVCVGDFIQICANRVALNVMVEYKGV